MALIHGLRIDNLRGDLFGGVTRAIVALPVALAFGVGSGAGPVAGPYGAIFVGFIAALFGGTPAQVSGPTGPMDRGHGRRHHPVQPRALDDTLRHAVHLLTGTRTTPVR